MVTDPHQNPSVEAAEGEYTLSLRPAFRALRRRLWVVALTVVVLTGIVVAISELQTPQYEAHVKVLIGQDQGFTESGADVAGLEELTGTMVEAVYTPSTAEAVKDRLDFRITATQFFGNLDAEQIPGTQFIDIRYTHPDPEKARQVAQATAEALSEQISEADPGTDAITATVWGQASVSENPVSPKPTYNGFLALVVSLFLGVGLAFLLEYLDDSWRLLPEEVEQIFGVPALGIIPKFNAGSSREKKGGKLEEAIAEAYRTLGTNLPNAFADTPPKVIAITSSGLREGTSTTCARLGVGLTQANKSVLVVDCNFREPTIHKLFGVHNLLGITNVLSDNRSPDTIWHDIQPRLKVLTVGSIPLNPTKFLSSKRFAEFVWQMNDQFDYVFLDTPPVGTVSETAVLVTLSDGVLLVVDMQSTRKRSVWRSVRSLQTVGANLLGIIINNAETSKVSYYGYY
jgi:capsular exopolysaccharide synthesis family protein